MIPISAEKITLKIHTKKWPLKKPFRISRGVKTHAETVIVELISGPYSGFGECTPYPRYGESVESVSEALQALCDMPDGFSSLPAIQTGLPAGAARNALDCAFHDLKAKQTGKSVAGHCGIEMQPLTTAYTLSLDDPALMFESAKEASSRPVLKIKLGGGEEDSERLEAVRKGAPHSQLIVDANEGWDTNSLDANLKSCLKQKVGLIEQPLPAGADDALEGFKSPIPICADESAHTTETIDEIASRYDAINIKLDKTGGLTEAMALAKATEKHGLILMVGCMVASSLAMAPATLVAQRASWVDLDGPLLLAQDHPHALKFEGSLLYPPSSLLWG